MEDHAEKHVAIEGELVAELLDQQEYPSKVGNVAAVSDRKICFLRHDRHELTHYRLDFLDVRECRAIEYRKEVVWYRVIAAIACFIGAAALVVMLVTGANDRSGQLTPLIVGLIALVSFGVRFVTSTHRHVMRFEMPGEVLWWRSPSIDFNSKAEAARAVVEFARKRGIFRDAGAH